jgi:hypothetical protein
MRDRLITKPLVPSRLLRSISMAGGSCNAASPADSQHPVMAVDSENQQHDDTDVEMLSNSGNELDFHLGESRCPLGSSRLLMCSSIAWIS